MKVLKSKNYNYIFNNHTGFFARWGKTIDDDPDFSPMGCEIADIEISTICNGIGVSCEFCYKSNSPSGTYMTFETFKKIFDKLPKTLMQIAFGIGDLTSNPDMWQIFEYCRKNNVIPNITTNGFGLTEEIADNLIKYCGAVAVSRYVPKDICYNAVKLLTDRGLKQCNIHQLLSLETYDDCLEVLADYQTDTRLEKLNAIVFLHLKPKGERNNLTVLKDKKAFKVLVDLALNNNIPIGFDSCTAPKFLEAVQGHPNYKQFEQYSESCESTLFSHYINVEGKTVPCSFLENEDIPELDVLNCNDFIKDIWNHSETIKFRNKLIANIDTNKCRKCPVFDLY